MIVAVGCPTVLALSHSCSVVVAPREVGTGSVGDQGVEGVIQQGGSNLMRAVGYLCSHRTWRFSTLRVIPR